MRILLVEDKAALARLISQKLHPEGFVTDIVGNLQDASLATRTTQYSAVILDRHLPDGDGLSWLRGMRRAKWSLPTVILSGACNGVQDRIEGLNAGADDYLVKPVELGELAARIRAVLRRPKDVMDTCLSAGNITLDVISRECRRNGELIKLTRREMCILEHMMRRFNRVVPKEALEESLYGHDDEVSMNSIEVGVHRVRKRLLQANASVTVETVRGIGYLLRESQREPALVA